MADPIKNLTRAREKAALIVALRGDRFQPIFARLDEELKKIHSVQDVLDQGEKAGLQIGLQTGIHQQGRVRSAT